MPSLFQSTPPRRGRLAKNFLHFFDYVRFQSTPPRRGRRAAARALATMSAFQSTPPRRGRLMGLVYVWQRWGVSIHAPAKGATALDGFLSPGIQCFNPRPREGGDTINSPLSYAVFSFNPRPREGGDVARPMWRHRRLRFQSTPPRRGRLTVSVAQANCFSVSIHAPAKGATWALSMYGNGGAFQSTPPRRGRPSVMV